MLDQFPDGHAGLGAAVLLLVGVNVQRLLYKKQSGNGSGKSDCPNDDVW